VSTDFSIIADGGACPLEPEAVEELLRRLKRIGIDRRNVETGEIIEQSASAAAASRLEAAISGGKMSFAPTDEDKGSIAWALREWLDDVPVDEFPKSAMTLRYALAAESKAPERDTRGLG
jgi:hypothetical protein